ncbi:MAG: LEA type 2 family protein [bacterium]|nr:LEA type 2 family protein [bacterium]
MKIKQFIIIFLLIALIPACATFDPGLFQKKPEAKLEKTDIDSITLQDITLLFDVKITNPYPVAINLAGVSTKFSIDGNQFFETGTKDQLKIPAKDSAMNTFKVNLKYADIINIIKDYSKKDYLNCDIEGVISLAVPRTGIPGVPEKLDFPYKLSKKIPALKPQIAIKGFSIKKPSTDEIKKAVLASGKSLNILDVISLVDKLLKGNYAEAFKVVKAEDLDLKFDINFNIELKNETQNKIDFSYFNYDFFLNSDKMVSGQTTDIKTTDNTTLLAVKNTVSLRAFSQTIVNAIRDKAGDFSLKGETAIKLPDEIKKEPLKLSLDEKGRLNIGVK